jgi:hypothetical protein
MMVATAPIAAKLSRASVAASVPTQPSGRWRRSVSRASVDDQVPVTGGTGV